MNISFSSSVQTGYGTHPASYPMGTGDKAEVKTAWIYTSTPSTRLHGVVLDALFTQIN
jgi:hypothetical protein